MDATQPSEYARLAADNEALCQANEALVLAAARYLALHDLAPVALVTIDRGGQLRDINDVGLALLGVGRDHALASRLTAMLAEPTRDAFALVLQRLFAVGRCTGVELVVARGPETIELAVDAIVLPDTGEPRAVLACVDVTARNREEAARRERAKRADDAQRLESLGALAGGVAHDFNNLMTVVLGGADAMLQDVAIGRHAETLLEIREAARHAGDLAHQMLAYAGRGRIPAHVIDVVDMVRRFEPVIRACASGTPISVDLAERPLCVTGDEPQLRQMLLNLVVNAAEAMAGRAGGIAIAVRAGAGDAGAHVVIEVRDAGSGMTGEMIGRIFDPYFSTKLAGRGLGLAVVHGVVRSHGGVMTVASELDAGSTFTVQLPVTAVAPARTATASATRAPALAGTVLLVDDDPLVRRLLMRVIGTLGLAVRAVDSGAAALEVVRDASLHVDLVVTDLTMPGMNGVELARAIRATGAALPIVLITGYGELPEDADQLFAGTLAKPFDLASLRALLHPLLTR